MFVLMMVGGEDEEEGAMMGLVGEEEQEEGAMGGDVLRWGYARW